MKKIALNTTLFGVATIAAATLSLVACGDSNTTETIVEKGATDIVASVADLPKCTAQNEGEQIFVKEDGLIRFCSDGKWHAVAGGESSSCSTKALKDSSGVKIICNGDSVGVVLNGKDGAQGIQGETGARGEQGIQGEKGERGDVGATGAAGIDGRGCTVVTLPDDSGLKVICGGDSVGVVLNGADGAKGDAGEGCSMTSAVGKLSITCAGKTVEMTLDENGAISGVQESILDSEKVAVSLDSVKGASQKGPFLSGSKVLVKELLDGRTLSQTGNNFDGKILNDKGEFKITARMLVSQYVMLEATGYYRNEVTGQNSSSPLTLFGITDVTTRNIVNINLLTHLEYERVIYLVTKKKMKVLDAKKQAQQEIFDILHIDNSNFSNSEDLSIAGSSDEDGALLAFSILFQGDRSVSQLTELLTRVSTAMEKEGKWEDATAKAEIADWAMAADTSYRLDSIRKYVADWKLGSMVPKFEPYVRNFWRVEHGLGSCGDTVKVGTVAKPTRGKTDAKVRFICAETDDGDIRWRIATDIEKDTYGWKDSTDGALKDGAVTKSVYVFDKLGSFNGVKGWRVAESVEKQHGGCREALYDSIRTDKIYAYYYTCDKESHTWKRNTNYLIIDTQYWPDSTDGDVRWGDSVGVVDNLERICYVWDDAPEYKGWRAGNESDCTLGLMGCTAKRMGEMRKTNDGRFYNCANNEWSEITDTVYINTRHYRCTLNERGDKVYKEGDLVYGIELVKTRFACENGEWRSTSAGEEQANRACTTLLQGEIQGDTITCDNRNWRPTIFYDYAVGEKNWFNPDLEYGDLIDKRDGRHYKTIKIGDQVWMAENLNYADSIASPYLRGQNWCYKDDSLNCLKGGRYYSWTAAMDIDTKWLDASPYAVDGLIENPHRGICPEGWHVPNNIDWDRTSRDCSDGEAFCQNVFSAFPAGEHRGDYYLSLGESSVYWSCEENIHPEYGPIFAYQWNVYDDFRLRYGDKYNRGLSVRCLCDSSDESICNNVSK